jgi:bile acid-coenzyme A ligase
MLDVQAARDPQRPALTCGSTTLTRGELALRARARALALQKLGVQEGDFVALALPNGTAVLELAFGCWMLGATPTPLSHRLPALELQAMIDVLQPRIAVVDERSVFDDANANSPLPARISPHVKAIASGGSTGRPKIIVDHTRAVLDPDAPSVGMRATDTVIIPGPMYHSAPFGLAYQALGWGCHVVIMPRFDAAETLRLVQAHRAEWLYQVPTMMHRIWRLDSARADYDVSSLELVCHIAAACPAWLKEKWIEWLGPDRVWEVYSGTEALGAIASVAIGLPDEDLGQRVHAIIEVRRDASLDLDALRDFLTQRLVTYKLPRSFETTFERLRDDSGKVRRNALRDARRPQ